MLDHMLTLHLIHVVVVSVWSRSVPASPRYWLVAAAHAVLCTIASEILAARTTAKEWAMHNDLANRAAAASDFDVPEQHELEASYSSPRPVPIVTSSGTTKPPKQTDKFVLFDEDGEDARDA